MDANSQGSVAMVSVLLVDDHVPTRQEMRRLVEVQDDMQVVAECGSGEDAILTARRLRPDIVIMDIVLPGITGVEATIAIVKDLPGTRVLALSNHSGRNLVRAVLDAGAVGFVRKNHAFEELIPAIRAACAGKRFLGLQVNE